MRSSLGPRAMLARGHARETAPVRRRAARRGGDGLAGGEGLTDGLGLGLAVAAGMMVAKTDQDLRR
jgi:hypothetical protein